MKHLVPRRVQKNWYFSWQMTIHLSVYFEWASARLSFDPCFLVFRSLDPPFRKRKELLFWASDLGFHSVSCI